MHLPPSYNLAADIAVIGAAGHFPGAAHLSEFWDNVVVGTDAGKALSEAELRAAGVSAQTYRQDGYVARTVPLQDHDRFDAEFFGYTPREAEIMNPEQRLLLQCSQHALEDAGYDSLRYPGRIGAFVGVSGGYYLYESVLHRADLVQRVGRKAVQFGNDPTFCATHVAYRLHLRGPAVGLHTACSTSLVAVHLACRSLLDFECEMALAGGAHIAGSHGKGYVYREGGILARDGYCRPFDAAASGTVSGSGAGAVVLKRLEDALAAGDRIIAVIKSTAINNDGADKVSFSAPSVSGQCECISSALEQADVHPEWIGFHETHGTGTVLGDPIEIQAATAAHRRRTQAVGYCALGALKANVGHMGSAAGIGGFIKVCQVLAKRTIPPLVHFRAPNPALQLERTPFRVPTTAEPWPTSEHARFASVSAFGMGGTNAHAVLCEAPATARQPSSRSWHLWPLSAATSEALHDLKDRMRATAVQLDPAERADAAFSLSVGRRELAERDYLLVPAQGSPLDGCARRTGVAPRVAMVFPGQGAQYPGMSAAAYAGEPVYRQAIDDCLERLEPLIDFDLRDLLLNPAADAQRLHETDAAQCAVFVSCHASATLWRHWGLKPAALIGHSIGEYVAACIAEVLSLDAALRMVAHRGRLMRQAAPGAMVAVSASEPQVMQLLGALATVEVAAVNTPQSCVLAGEESSIADAVALLRRAGIVSSALHTSHAFHSRSMAAAAAAFEEIAADFACDEPRIPYISNVTGDWIDRAQLRQPRYWVSQIRERVQFAAGVDRLLHSGVDILLEVGPGQSMSRMLRSVPQWNRALIAASARHVQGDQGDQQVLAESFGALWSAGVELLPERRYSDEPRQRVALPLTAFARDRHWLEPRAATAAPASFDDDAGSTSSCIDEWLYLPGWRRQARPASTADDLTAHWLVLGPDDALLSALADRVRASQGVVTRVLPGAQFRFCDAHLFQVCTSSRADYELLAGHMRDAGPLPLRIAYAWPIDADDRAAQSPQAELLDYLNFLQGAQSLLQLEKVSLLCLTRRGAGVAGETVDPGRAMLGAATRVVGQEFPRLHSAWIDVGEHRHTVRLAARILEEAAGSEPAMALRGDQCWVPDYVQDVSRPPAAGVLLRETGCYLITGGLGGIGLSIAEHFAAKRPVRLVLVGRNGLPPRDQWPALATGTDDVAKCIRRIQAIEQGGSEVMVAAADVADALAMGRAIDSMQRHFGRCHGLIHAAGIVAGAMIMRQSCENVAAALAPKATGLHVLERLLPFAEMDFVLLCSSQNALKGGVGRFGYAAANAYMDAYAQVRASQDERIVVRSVNWAAWAETGMAARSGRPSAQRRRQMFLTAEALSMLDRVLLAEEPRLVISKLPVNELLDGEEGQPPESGRAAVIADAHARPPQVRAQYVQPEGQLETQLAAIWTDVLGVAPIGRRDDFFELGGNSLMMIQVGACIQDRFNVQLTARDLFSACTVQQLASRLAPVADESVADLCNSLEALSADELDDVLARYAEET